MENLFENLKLKRRGIALLASMHFFGNPSAKLKIVGVTGTSGKTTTATLLYKIAMGLGYKAGLISTVENIINGEIVVIQDDKPIPGTTLDPIHLNKLLTEMVEKNCEYVFMEVSSQGMDQNRVAGINFIGGIFTNLTHDHLDYHKNIENYFLAKKKFFKMLPKPAFALANTDDKSGEMMLDGIKARRLSYGFNGYEDFRGEIKKLDFDGLELAIQGTYLSIERQVKTKLLGKFNAYNILAVWSVCKLLDFDIDQVNKILENIAPPRGRFEHFTSPNGVLVIVDYAHTPDQLEKIFGAVKEVNKTKGKLISVFGCGGDRDQLKRPIMGKTGVINSDIAIFTSDNPRSEDPEKIIEQMKTTLSSDELAKVKTISDRREAILEAVKIAQSGDIILCAGKGHEDYQIIQGVKSYFDDMEELKRAYEKI